MSDYQFDSQDKIVQQMTRDGLIQENAATGEQERISERKEDYQYNPAKAVETAINAASEIHYYKKLYSSSDEPEPEDIPEDKSSPYKSPYSHGEYQSSETNQESASTDKEDKKEDSKNGKEGDKENFNRKSSEKDYSFNRKNKKDEKIQRKLEKYDRKIEAADKRVEEKLGKIPTVKEKKLKFEKVSSVNKKGEPEGHYRLKYKTERKLTEKEYNKKNTSEKLSQRMALRTYKSALWDSWGAVRSENRDDIHETSLANTRAGLYYGARKFTRAVNNIKSYTNPYSQLKRAESKAGSYRLRRDEAEYKSLPKEQKQYQKQLQKKKYKKAALQKNLTNEQQRIVRHNNIFKRAKEAAARVIKAVKSFLSILCSGLSIVIIVLAVIFGIIILVVIAVSFTGESVIRSTYQADYNQISGCTAYMQSLETDLKERISRIETEECPGCYEYIYNLGEIGHDSISLMSYLAAKYIEFDLDKCSGELDSIFEEMYTLIIEVREEERERPLLDEHGNSVYDEEGNPVNEIFMARICYITLEVKPLEDIVEERLSSEQKEQYDTYMMSGGGQQVYANCLTEDWSRKISSKFGERIHPITGERTFHNGVDIAIPENTPVYSSTPGIVTTSAYSETAGNYIIITMEGGWCVKYMHLNAREVSAGDVIVRGQFIGQSGNTGRSTGPHLHLEVRDAENNPVDPTFMIPGDSVIIEKEEGVIQNGSQY